MMASSTSICFAFGLSPRVARGFISIEARLRKRQHQQGSKIQNRANLDSPIAHKVGLASNNLQARDLALSTSNAMKVYMYPAL